MTGVFWSALAAGLFWDGGGLVTLGLTQGLYKGKCQLIQIPNQVRDDGLVLGMTEVGFCTALREPQGPAFDRLRCGFRDRASMPA